MKITRVWAMPNKNTFTIKPIKYLIDSVFIKKGLMKECISCDPFVNDSPFKERCQLTNDLNPDILATSHEDALSFLQKTQSNYVDVLLFDPPYSPRQVSECYKRLGKSVNMQTTQSSYWGNLKKEIARVVKSNGIVVTCGWNSGGIGKENGFIIEEVLIVPHGGWHNDTIVTVEFKSTPLVCNKDEIELY